MADASRLRAGRRRRPTSTRCPRSGCLISTGFPRFKGGTGGLVELHRDLPARRQGREDLARRRAAEEVQLTAALGRDHRDPRPLSRRSAVPRPPARRAGAGRRRRRPRRRRRSGRRSARTAPLMPRRALRGDLVQHLRERRPRPARRRRRTCRRRRRTARRWMPYARACSLSALDGVEVLVAARAPASAAARSSPTSCARSARSSVAADVPALDEVRASAAAPSARAACRAAWRSAAADAP